ncbi:GNAT family N-acetyltransferase [uncultured Imperialibacter sp.]|uniref:GNAT family N-acetyltransferase n=1 Tax=uncultured Imperialibacter sp. TaxID=1672639 RepID=UPI0030DCEE8B|tara:strand:+ start:576 stop:1046 length:471 start_codon:yes stop_codon:yes gene_type:complete
MTIEFRQLSEVSTSAIVALMNNPLVRRQMPLLTDYFDEAACAAFVAAKTRLWDEHGYGPWAFVVDDVFAGWGGLQPEAGEADLALVLHPGYWGLGKKLYQKIIGRAFTEMGLESVTVLFPPSRTRVKGLLRLGFTEESEVYIGQHRFIKYRLRRPA